jgi:hypothetical protein
MPIIPDPGGHDQFLNEHAPELQRLLTKRTAIAERIQRLHAAGLCTHVAQALWRTATASDATFTARTTGLDLQTAEKLDRITTEFWEKWLNEPLTHADKVRLFSSLSDGGLGFTSAQHIKDAALVASWIQAAPAFLGHMQAPNMETLLSQLPKTHAQIQAAITRVDPAYWKILTEITPGHTIKPHQQKQLTNTIRKKEKVAYTNSLTAVELSVYLSTGDTGAGAWLHAPIKDITPLSNEHFAISTKLRLNKVQTRLSIS